MWRNCWLSLSFANLVYLRAWSDLFPLKTDDVYYRKTLPDFGLYFGVAGDVLALSLLTFLLISFAPRLAEWLKRVLLVVAVAMVALALHAIAPSGFVRAGLLGLPLLGLLCAGFAGLAFMFPARAFRLAQTGGLAATPCLAVTFAACFFNLQFQKPMPPDPPLAPRLAGSAISASPVTRVFWILFDEWDQRLSFPDRSAGILLPVLDHLASRSFIATRALAPLAGIPVPEMATADAVPSLLYGRRSSGSEIENASTRILVFSSGGPPAVFGAGDSVFARARALGWNAAAAGWYLPYCRVFAAQLTDCYWDVRYDQKSSARPSLAGAAVDETRMLFETPNFSLFGPSIVNVRHVAEYEALLAAARRYAADPSIGLAFIHMNIPHVPYFYNPKIGRLGRYGYSHTLYDDALEQVDKCVGDILSVIEKAGLDSKTAIILSSDHPERNFTDDPHVPFIVHLPGEIYGATSGQEFSTLNTADLALAIGRGDVRTPPDVAKFLAGSVHSR